MYAGKIKINAWAAAKEIHRVYIFVSSLGCVINYVYGNTIKLLHSQNIIYRITVKRESIQNHFFLTIKRIFRQLFAINATYYNIDKSEL